MPIWILARDTDGVPHIANAEQITRVTQTTTGTIMVSGHDIPMTEYEDFPGLEAIKLLIKNLEGAPPGTNFLVSIRGYTTAFPDREQMLNFLEDIRVTFRPKDKDTPKVTLQ